MMNQEIDRIDECSRKMDPRIEVTTPTRRDTSDTQQYINLRLWSVAQQTLEQLGHGANRCSERSLRQTLVYLGGQYQGGESQRFMHYCRGMQLMAQHQFRAAVTAFEFVLIGQVEQDFEPFRRMALELHSLCLEELEFDEQSMEQFTQLLYQKFEETRTNGQPDDVARTLGLGGLGSAMSL